MKYKGFYFLLFKGSMKKVLIEKYDKAYASEIIKKSKIIYRKLIEEADDIGKDNPMAYNEMFALAFIAPYIASEKKIPPETIQEMMRQSLYSVKWYFSFLLTETLWVTGLSLIKRMRTLQRERSSISSAEE